MSGLVVWPEITRLEVGVRAAGKRKICVVLVSYKTEPYGADPGFLGLHMSNTGAHRVMVLNAALRAELFIPVDRVHADFRAESL
jgi:hypothetical protein